MIPTSGDFSITSDKSWLIKFVEHRVADHRILRLIQKWLNAGVMEEGKWSDTKTGELGTVERTNEKRTP